MFYGDYTDNPSTPLFAFGHGLSYTTWSYDAVTVEATDTTGDVTVAVELRNAGDRAGEEVVQVFASDTVASVGVPARRLVAFERVAVAASGACTLRFTIPAARLGFHGADLRYRVEPGTFVFRVAEKEVAVELDGDVVFPDLNHAAPSRCDVLDV
jgi:beta-glucosidase